MAEPMPRPTWRRYGALGVLLAGLTLSACDGGGESQAAQGGGEPPPPSVTVAAPLTREIVEWDEFTGRFEAINYVEVRARVSGYLDAVHFTDGQLVERGDLLFTIDQRPFAIAVEQAQAAVAAAEAAVAFADQQLARARELVQRNNIAEATLDERISQKSQADADLLRVQAELRDAELNLNFTTVEAPIAGRISDRRVDVGNLITEQTLLTNIVALDPLYFEFDMAETDFLAYQRAIQRGALPSTRSAETKVGIKLIDEIAWSREGSMSFVDNQVAEGTGTLRARAQVPNPDLLITPGQFGYVRIPGSPLYEAVLIPPEAVVTDQSNKIVMLVDEDDTVRPRPIREGPNELGLRVVRDGLRGDERMIINGLMRARPGMVVNPEPGEVTIPEAFQAEAAANNAAAFSPGGSGDDAGGGTNQSDPPPATQD